MNRPSAEGPSLVAVAGHVRVACARAPSVRALRPGTCSHRHLACRDGRDALCPWTGHAAIPPVRSLRGPVGLDSGRFTQCLTPAVAGTARELGYPARDAEHAPDLRRRRCDRRRRACRRPVDDADEDARRRGHDGADRGPRERRVRARPGRRPEDRGRRGAAEDRAPLAAAGDRGHPLQRQPRAEGDRGRRRRGADQPGEHRRRRQGRAGRRRGQAGTGSRCGSARTRARCRSTSPTWPSRTRPRRSSRRRSRRSASWSSSTSTTSRSASSRATCRR